MAQDTLDLIEVKDSQWIRQAFYKRGLGGAGGQKSTKVDRNTLHFYDTTLGGNRAINPLPQFTKYSDIKEQSISYNSKGMGNYYKEAIDENAQRISLQFGIPEYNSLTSFLSTFYDRDAGQLVNRGEISTASTIGYALGVVFTLPVQAYFGLNYLYTRISAVLSGNPYSKFYYFSPTMAIYWNAVTILYNKLCTEMGASVGAVASDLKVENGVVTYADQDADTLGLIRDLMPDVIKGTGNATIIDVKSISSRSQRMANTFEATMDELLNSASTKDELSVAINNLLESKAQITRSSEVYNGMEEYLSAHAASPLGDGLDNPQAIPELDENNEPVTPESASANGRSVRVREASVMEYLKSELREGSAFVTFNVEEEGPISSSFNTTTKTPAIKEAANAASSKARGTSVNFAGGNIGTGFIANAVEAVTGGVKDLLGGAASAVGLQGIGALAGAAYMDMPDVIDTSTAELPSTQYKMRLATPYGNRYSILTRIYLPLCMILAGALPRSTGPSSYSTPFLCRLHSQGKNEIKLGVIDSLSIEIGTSNIARNKDGLPTAIDVTFSVKNLDSIMSVPVANSLSDELTSFSAFKEDSVLSDFLVSLAGVSLSDQYYMANRLSRAFANQAKTWNSFTSPSYFSQWFASTTTGSLISALMRSGDI